MGKVALKTVLKNFLNHFETLESRRKSNSDDDLYHKEFHSLKELTESLKKDPDYSCSKGLQETNIRKNRYKDILPYDYSRVILSEYPGIPGSDYVNANFVKGSTGNSCYIASQGPLPCTVVDFYRMIWECDVTVIVMACNETESGRFKCECYWPQSTDQEQQYGNITVSLVKWKHVCPDFLVRTLKIRANDEERVVCQFHYLTWPDHSIPPSVSPILELVRLIRDVQASEARPILVHCSAGCGRTGTICTIDYVWALLRTGKLKEDFSLYSIISDMRRQRIAMVQTKEQYILCYRAVATLFEQQLKMIDAHTYENLNEDGEPLVNSDNDDEEEAEDATADEDEQVNKQITVAASERESESLSNSEEESYCRTQPDVIRTRRKKRDSHFGSLRQSRLHKSTPDFEFDAQPIANDLSKTNSSSKHEAKLVGKATVIRRPNIAHLKAMFENMNLPNPDGFVHSYGGGRNNKAKPSLLKRSMSTREKVGSFNTWSTNHLNMFGQHGSFENLNFFGSKESGWKEKNLSYPNDSNESDPEEPIKADPFYDGGDAAFDKRETDNGFDQTDCNQFNEPVYGFPQPSVSEIDKSYIIENVADLPAPPKPPRQFTYQQNEEPFNGPVAAAEFKSSADTMLNNRSLNSSHAIDYNLPSYLSNKLSASKNYYNTIGPIKHREARPSMIYCFNDTNYPKTAYNQSKSTYNIASLQAAKESQPSDLFETPISRSKSINELSNNCLYELPGQRFGVLSNGAYKNPTMPIQTAPLPNHLIKPNPTNAMHMGNHLANNMNNNVNNNVNVQFNANCYQHEPQDFYGYIGLSNGMAHSNHLNNVNHLNSVNNKPILQQSAMTRGAYQLPTLPKPNLQQFSNTLPAHYTTQISLNSQQQQHQQQQQQHQQQHQQHQQLQQQQQQQQQAYGQQHPPKVQPPMSYVKPTMRNTSAIGLQQQNSSGNFRNQPLSANTLNTANNPNNGMNNLNKHISNGNLPNGRALDLMNGNAMNGSAMNGSAISGNPNATMTSMGTTPNNVPNGIPNSTSAMSLSSKNYYNTANNYKPASFSQSSLIHMNSLQQRKENGQANDEAILKDDSSSAHNNGSACANGHASKADKLSKEKQNSHRQNDKYGEKCSTDKSNESTSVVKTKKKSAFTTLSALFGLKRKKDSKKANGSTTNLSAISVSNGTANNGTNLMRPPHFHRFAQEAQWTQV